MFNSGKNHWWIDQLAQRTKTKNLLPLQRAKSNEEEQCSVKHPQTKNEKKLLGTNCQWASNPFTFDQTWLYYSDFCGKNWQLTVNLVGRLRRSLNFDESSNSSRNLYPWTAPKFLIRKHREISLPLSKVPAQPLSSQGSPLLIGKAKSPPYLDPTVPLSPIRCREWGIMRINEM